MPHSFLDRLAPAERALEADAARLSRLDHAEFLLRLGSLFLLSWIAWKSGLSRALADGLRGWFSGTRAWPMTHICLVAFCVFAYEIALFPLAALREILDPPPAAPDGGPDGAPPPNWASDWVKTILLDTAFSTAIATALYALMWFFPARWWLAATAIYAVFVVGLSVWGPSLLLPRVTPPRPLDDPALLAAIQAIGRDAGLDIADCALWTPPEGARDRIVLAGTGRRRTLLVDAELARRADTAELLFLAALRIAGHKHGLDLLLRAAETLLAAAVFLGMDRWMAVFSGQRGIPDFFQPEVFPVWICILFGFASAGGLAMNWLNRRATLRRDAFAMAHAGGPEALLRHLKTAFALDPFPASLRWWQIPLSNVPPPSSRLAAAATAPRPPRPENPGDTP
ncbi:MAG: hypothetical protein IKQ55_12535 [Kiritimatiellae bacterium]|nr:hypothetical protein [Kiritimatiellia bacterium]